jgi:hypothetical protein
MREGPAKREGEGLLSSSKRMKKKKKEEERRKKKKEERRPSPNPLPQAGEGQEGEG